ncbi:TPA: sugar-binding protein [Streptococcus pneumoniae]|nr:sugar-binding protein [Streptococcus pneumoniae]
MEWYKKIGLLATTGLALFGLSACSNYGKSADDTVTIEYFNQKKEMTKTFSKSLVILRRKTLRSRSKSSMYQMLVKY